MSEPTNTDTPASQTLDNPPPADATAPTSATADPSPSATDTPPNASTDYSIDYPEGHEVFNDVKANFETLVKTVGLSKEQAQQLVELGMNQSQQIIASMEAKKAAEVSAWETATKSDKELGGDRLNETLSIAGKALAQFTSPEFKELLNQTGIGNHPEMIRMFYKIGQQISEDGFVNGNNNPKTDLSSDPMRRMDQIANSLYPSS